MHFSRVINLIWRLNLFFLFALIAPPFSVFAQGVKLNISGSLITENNSSNFLTFTATLSLPTSNTVSVDYQTSPGVSASTRSTALVNYDYIPTAGTISFPVGSTSQTFTATIIGDTLKEGPERFYIVYSNLVNATFGSNGNVTAGTIIDDDSQNVLPGFTSSKIITNLFGPTRMQFAPDGRLFICEQEGTIRIFKDNQLLPNRFLKMNVNSMDGGEAGLIGLAFDPGFATNQYLFLFYSAWGGAPGAQPWRNRISRFTVDGDEILTNSEVIVFQQDQLTTTGRHNAGDIHFGPDGKLYASTGDGGVGTNAQSLNSIKGKILRLNSDGSIPEENPFYDVATNENRAIWCMGLRNPFTFTFQPGTSRMFINDVGENTWEEINEGFVAGNYGWPTVEGPSANMNFLNPTFALLHSGENLSCGGSITGGAFYNPATNVFRTEDFGCYFFADFCNGWVQRLSFINGGNSTLFANDIPQIVDLKVGPDGNLYCLSRGDVRTRYTGYVSKIECCCPGEFLILSAVPDGTQIVITWESKIGESYRVQTKDSLSDPFWSNATTLETAVSTTTSFTNTLSQATRYYRISRQ